MTIKSYEEYSFKLDQIEGLVDLGPLGRTHETAKHVFVFCLDSINARNPWRQPLAYFLSGTDFVEWCSKWSISPNRLSKILCLKGFSLTVKAILGIYKELAKRYEEFELATGLCNQDSAEHLFSKLRQRGGFNPNPTARMVRLSLRHIISTGYIPTSDKGNVQCPEAQFLINSPSHLVKTLEDSLSANHTVVQSDANSEDESFVEDTQFLEEYDNVRDAENVESLNIYDQNAVAFFAGYIARRSVAKTKCDNCRNYMMKTPMDNVTENEMYIEYREYPNADEDAPT
ncbi:transposable element p transposase, partial [Lasius niger]